MQHQTVAAERVRILRPGPLAERLGISTATIWRMRRRGEFPDPIRLSPGAVGWPSDVIDEWLAARCATSGALEPAGR